MTRGHDADAAAGRAGPAPASARHWAAIPLISLLWGMNWPTQALALHEISPWTLRTMTLGGGGLLLLAVSLLRGHSLRIPLREWPRVVLFTLLYIVAQNLLISFAQLLAPSGRMAIVTYTMPIWTTVLAALLLHEPVNRARRLSLAFGTLGLAALAWPAIHTGTYWGWVLALGSAWCWAASVILIKRYPVSATPRAVTTWQLILGGACMCIGMLVVDGVPAPGTLSMIAGAAIAYNILSQAVSQVLWFDTLGRMPAVLASLGVLMVPPVAMVGSMLLLHEQPTLLDGLGLVLITCASAAVQIPWPAQWPRRKPRAARA